MMRRSFLKTAAAAGIPFRWQARHAPGIYETAQFPEPPALSFRGEKSGLKNSRGF
jgi:hypothetical protein